MKTLSTKTALPVVLLGLVASAAATTPDKQAPKRYSTLWEQSPFTVPRESPVPDPPSSELDDFVLTGVSKLPAGYFVALMSKKDRNKRVVIVPGEPNPSGFEVVNVIQDPADYMATQVRISVRGKGTRAVGYDPKGLAPRAPSTPRQANPPVPVAGSPEAPSESPTVDPAAPTATRPSFVRQLPTPRNR